MSLSLDTKLKQQYPSTVPPGNQNAPIRVQGEEQSVHEPDRRDSGVDGSHESDLTKDQLPECDPSIEGKPVPGRLMFSARLAALDGVSVGTETAVNSLTFRTTEPLLVSA